MVPPSSAPDADLAALRAETAHLRRVNQELLATVAELRSTIEKQQVHIERLVRMTFGRRSERVTGPTLFDDVPNADQGTVHIEEQLPVAGAVAYGADAVEAFEERHQSVEVLQADDVAITDRLGRWGGHGIRVAQRACQVERESPPIKRICGNPLRKRRAERD